ncbi:Pentatricopeptide repeat-containing protein At1g08070, chloroplastic [Linum perenne]
MIITGFLDDTFAAGKLLKFSTDSLFIPLTHSHRIFTHIRNPNGFVYNTMMRAHVQRNNPEQALLVYKLMRGDSVGPDTYTYPLLLQSCSQRLAEFQGRLIHGHVFKVGFDSDVYVQNTLINLYAVCGKLGDARQVFDESPVLDLVSWNSMLAGYVSSRNVEEARKVFDEMTERDLVSWTALISCYEQNEMHEDALKKFKEMVFNGVLVDEKLFSYGCCLDLISWNSMISGYLKCGEFAKARSLFDSMPRKDTVSWSVMISGYAQRDKFADALALFQDMQNDGFEPDDSILVSAISACTHLSALDRGVWIHDYIRKKSLKINVILGTTLIDMHMKFGSVENAIKVFNELEEKGVSTWNALILGLAMNGMVKESLETFSEMKECGILPNEITFLAVLGACRHMGLVDEGRRHFDSMVEDHGIKPTVKHYGCMVDLLGRAGKLREAEELIDSMPMAPDVSTWGALLGACTKYEDNVMGERVGRKLIEFQPDHDGFHVLLSNIYASRGDWNDAHEVRGTMRKHRVVKMPGCSMIEANGIVHEFSTPSD